MPLRTLAALTVLFVTLSGCVTFGGRSRADSPGQRGRAIAQGACAACHAVEPGREARPGAKAPAFGSLEMRHTVGLEGRLADLTRLGHYGMPPVTLTAGEVSDLRVYIESLHLR